MNRPTSNSCDLHIHSLFSDSDASLESIFTQASERSLRSIAITDHDTVAGLPEAYELSKKFGVELIPGIEMSTQHQDREVHLLGYFIDIGDASLARELVAIKALRRDRLIEMAAALNDLGVAVDVDELMTGIGDTMATRLHLALYLLKKKKTQTLREAFSKYLAPGRPAYRSHFKHSVPDAISLIHRSKGLAFLAHPHMLAHQEWVEEFIRAGLDGLEVAYPSMSLAKRTLYEATVQRHALLKSGGSDAHGSYKEFTRIGTIHVPHEWVEQMRSKVRSVS